MLYPKDAPLPNRLETDEFVILSINTSGVTPEEYFAAYHNFAPDIYPDIDDLEEILWRTSFHLERLGFTFLIRDHRDSNRLIGGINIRPAILVNKATNVKPGKREASPHCEAVVSFWVLQSKQIENLDRRLLKTLIHWFKEAWVFTPIFFELEMSNDRRRQMQLFTEAGLNFQFLDQFGNPIYGERRPLLPSRYGQDTLIRRRNQMIGAGWIN